MNPYDHLESEQKRKDENRHYIFYNKECLCDHGGLHPMLSRKRKYTEEMKFNTDSPMLKYR